MTAAERTALTAHLAAASAGPHPPPIDRLQAAAEYVIDRARPDQVILFGSAARGEFRPDSDFDFLVIEAKNRPLEGPWWDSWMHPKTQDRLDLIFETAGEAPKNRWTAGTVNAIVFAFGATIYTANGQTPIRTLRDQGIKPEIEVKQGKYDVRQALDVARRSRTHLRNADNSAGPGIEEDDWQTATECLQQAYEKSFKALLIAHDCVFEYTHRIGDLLTAVRSEPVNENPPGTERIDAESENLAQLSEYGKGAGYDWKQGASDPKTLFRKFRPGADRLVAYVKTRVDELLDAHDRARIETKRRELDEGIPIRPSARAAKKTTTSPPRGKTHDPKR